MDPVEGRFVLHGHISESGPIIQGALAPDAVNAVVGKLSDLATEVAAWPERYHGPVVLRFTVQPTGKVEDAVILVDRVARGDQIPNRRGANCRHPARAGNRPEFSSSSGEQRSHIAHHYRRQTALDALAGSSSDLP
jgi:hypothetical protein